MNCGGGPLPCALVSHANKSKSSLTRILPWSICHEKHLRSHWPSALLTQIFTPEPGSLFSHILIRIHFCPLPFGMGQSPATAIRTVATGVTPMQPPRPGRSFFHSCFEQSTSEGAASTFSCTVKNFEQNENGRTAVSFLFLLVATMPFM